jgi:peptidoglycan/xylan/chitin deacetylase (PgdA/CDA1 family)
MKRIANFLVSILLFAASLLSTVPAFNQAVSAAVNPNLIANPSVEVSNGASPTGWTGNGWGTSVVTHTYENEGSNGVKSIKTQVANHVSGDAKWMPDAVSVLPNTSYTYSEYYKSNTSTEIDIRFTDAIGNVTYQYIQWFPPAAGWTATTVSFVTPANAVSAVPMHIIATNGWLQIDDMSLSETVAAPAPTADNLIANGDFETANGNRPAAWVNSSWGTNVSQFSYDLSGHGSARSATVTVASIVSGDAKWYAESIAVTAGKTYSYSDYYKSNVTSRVVAAFVDASGNYTYSYLGQAAIAADWTKYATELIVPAGAVKVSIYHLIDQVGFLSIDDVVLREAVPLPPVDDENAVPNSSLESVDGTMPAGWIHSSWGVNTAQFTHATAGRTGTRSVTTTVSAYTTGDAKWYFKPVSVVANKSYIYRDYYKSNVVSQVVAAFIDASGNYTYSYLGQAAVAADWTKYEATITIPSTAVQATVFHLIDKVGVLTIDDVLLQVAVPAGQNINVPNASLEEGAATPTAWNIGNWGSNTATFQYVTNEGYTGSRSAKVTVSNYVSGDAKWFFNPINTLTPGSQYRFSTWYKGTVTPHVVALYMKADNTERYVNLSSPLTVSPTVWTKYSDTFTVPEGVVRVSLFMYIAQNGWLQTDDYSISTYHPNGFNRPLLSLTFDDGHEENATTALPLLKQYGFKTTQCYATSFIEGVPGAADGVLAFFNDGHEICSHTVSHPFLTSLSSTDLDYELRRSKQYLEGLIGQPVVNFASPYGDYNAAVNDVIDNYYGSHRTVDEGFNSKDNFDIYRMRVQNVLDTTTAAQVQTWIEQAQADNTWLILVYHRVANNPGPYDTNLTLFAEQLQAIAASGIQVLTMRDALAEVNSQL